jgi:hypothetical protein
MSGIGKSGKWLGYGYNTEESWLDSLHRQQIYVFFTMSERGSGAEQDAYSVNNVGAVTKGFPKRQGHLHPVPSLPRACTMCKVTSRFTFTVFKILHQKRRQYRYQGHDYLHIRNSLWKCRQYFPPKRRHSQYITQVHNVSLIKSLPRLLFFLWWRFDLSRIGRGWKHCDHVLIFKHRFPMAHNSP